MGVVGGSVKVGLTDRGLMKANLRLMDVHQNKISSRGAMYPSRPRKNLSLLPEDSTHIGHNRGKAAELRQNYGKRMDDTQLMLFKLGKTDARERGQSGDSHALEERPESPRGQHVALDLGRSPKAVLDIPIGLSPRSPAGSPRGSP